jgi:hypothetical protein
MVSHGDARFLCYAISMGTVGSQISTAIFDLLFDIPIPLFPTLIYLSISAKRK